MRLAALTHRPAWAEAARRGFGAIAALLNGQALAVAEALLAVDFATDAVLDVGVVWPDGKRAAAEPHLAELRRHFVPNRVICGGSQSEIADLSKQVPWMAGKVAMKDAATVYVCQSDGTCKLPVQKPEELAGALGKAKAYAHSHDTAAASLH